MKLTTNLTIESKVVLRSGFSIPQLGLGVYQNKGETVVTACLAAFEAGYRHVDSAQLYRNETEVGQAVVNSGLKREEVFVTTKIRSFDSENVGPLLTESLSKFNFEYVDLLLIHDPKCGPTKRLKMWRDVLKARDDGKAKTVGVSNFGVRHLQEIVDAGLEIPAVTQIELHPFCQQRDIVEWCRQHQVAVQAYCPIMRGKNWENPILKGLAKKYGKGVEHILVRWSLQKGFIPLPKSSQPERVKSNANVYDFQLSTEDVEEIDKLDLGDLGALSWNPVNSA